MKLKKDFEKARAASRELLRIKDEQVRKVLLNLADEVMHAADFLLGENRRDLDRMDPADPRFDRLKLDPDRLQGIATDLRNVAGLPTPLGEVLEERILKNGLKLKKIRVALGVVGIIYEARPNVSFDVFSLCLKSGNVCLLKGGRDAEYSNKAIIEVIHRVLRAHQIPADIVQLLPASREATSELLQAVDEVDIIIPRGSQQLIDYVRENASVPVIETGAGIVHTYYDRSADPEMGADIIVNAKLRRVSVCNALDCLIIHNDRLQDLPELTERLAEEEVILYADEPAYKMLRAVYPEALLFKAEEEHFGTEFLSKKLAIRTVSDMDEALDHISRYSSMHSEAIIARDESAIERFFNEVDAAVVYANTSTAFTDGAQFEMGAEIGISTQKLHARGPMALRELTSYKWVIRGEGQVRAS